MCVNQYNIFGYKCCVQRLTVPQTPIKSFNNANNNNSTASRMYECITFEMKLFCGDNSYCYGIPHTDEGQKKSDANRRIRNIYSSNNSISEPLRIVHDLSETILFAECLLLNYANETETTHMHMSRECARSRRMIAICMPTTSFCGLCVADEIQ